MKIILASGSPRRRELLSRTGFDFTVQVSNADENVEEEVPEKLVEELAQRKAKAVFDLQKEDCLVIGADTIVVKDGKTLGKPKDKEEAVEMLLSISGRTHQVYTGVALFMLREGKCVAQKVFHECTEVEMTEMTEQEIRAYVKSGEPLDKAGAYGIQGKAAVFIRGIRGDYYNVVGLPVCRVYHEMQDMFGEK
ncbi:MAG: Maf family protein [Eubacterium sp.]|nr:Maf family protein [Eubacterium sp.]MDD7209727.1 Maf family protein [Lachnospiraceae bacterium]MDY5498166.1 Maf family protein [Anaerobutyricum sp.]